MEKEETGQGAELVVAVGLSGSKKGKLLLKWALDKFLPEGNVRFVILHVFPKIVFVQTPIGSWLPISEVQDDVASSYKQEIDWKKKKLLQPYQKTLKAQKVESDIVALESDDIAAALCSEVNKSSIRHLVVGSSSSGTFSWKSLSLSKMVEQNLSTVISETAPSICSVYVVADGKLQHLRPSESKPTVISVNNTSGSSSAFADSPSRSSSPTLGNLLKNRPHSDIGPASNSSTSNHKRGPSESYSNNTVTPTITRESLEATHYRNYSSVNQGYSSGDSGSWVSDRTSPAGSFAGSTPAGSSVSIQIGGSFTGTPPTGSYVGNSPAMSFGEMTPPGSFVTARPGLSSGGHSSGFFAGNPHPHQPSARSDPNSSQGQVYELEKLRMELRHVEKMYELTQNTNMDEKLSTLSKELEAALKMNEAKDKEISNTENNRLKAEKIEEAKSDKNGDRNTARSKEARAVERAEDNENKLKQLLASPVTQCQKFSWDEIMEATSSLSEEFKIGTGAFGTVFKCKLHHTTAAVKVLHSKDTVTNKQFLQELEILSIIRHPHLLLLLGAVPEESCLVYEYMENGSLDDRLFRKDNCPPLPWYERIRICWEVASALAFLHSTKPRPIIHRDLKPANILLDQHLVSKIGDAGLGTTMNVEPTDKSLRTLYKETSPVGTLCYIDPEYQRTGRVSTKSDVYALGVVILQLLTTKPAVGIAYLVEDALEEGTLPDVLDKEAGTWDEDAALELAKLGLNCSELRGRDRPDLREIVLPTLERLKELADKAREAAASATAAMPAHFTCPIRKVVMEDPYVAADGYTYDREAIEQWLEGNNTSPTTNLELPHKFIMPNYTLLEAIKQWKSKQPVPRVS